MGYLFDTNALSELFRKRPNLAYVRWLRGIPAEQQHTSIVVVGELYAGIFGSPDPARWEQRYEEDVFPQLTVLDFDRECARIYGRIESFLMKRGRRIGPVDAQIAATALRHGLAVVTANARHFSRVPDLRLIELEPGQAGALYLGE